MKKKVLYIACFIVAFLLMKDCVLASKTYSCPENYTLAGELCIKRTTDVYTRNGYQYCICESCTKLGAEWKVENNVCIWSMKATIISDGNDDSNDDNNDDSNDKPKINPCPLDYTLLGDFCVKSQNAYSRSGVEYCPPCANCSKIGATYTLEDGVCVWSIPVKDLIDIQSSPKNSKNYTTVEASSICDILNDDNGVGLYLKGALKIIRYGALILVVILGVLDFIKAMSAEDQDSIKKAFQSFLKRMAAVIILFLLPAIIGAILWIINLPGVTDDVVAFCNLY